MVNLLVTPWRKADASAKETHTAPAASTDEKRTQQPRRWNLGILSDPQTDEVPGSVILLSRTHNRNEPLGLQHAHARTSASSLPSVYGSTRSASRGSPQPSRSHSRVPDPDKKRTKDGRFILDPQPEESANDPLNWRQVRRDLALVSLGFYCMIGGGMTPLLAAGFNDVAKTYHVSIPQVALTTGLYMLGLGLGSVVASPTAILWGKRPVYLGAIILFTLSSIWCAVSPNYASLVVARIVQGFAVSPVECLPSATIAEIFFLHERAYRLGIYTLLLLGGKNLIPLVSAVIVQSLGWRWVFWITAIVVGFCFFLIFFFVPETFWDRTPSPHKHHHLHFHLPSRHAKKSTDALEAQTQVPNRATSMPISPLEHATKRTKPAHVGFADDQETSATVSRRVDLADVERDARGYPTSGSGISVHSTPAETTRHDYFPSTTHNVAPDPEKADSRPDSRNPSSMPEDPQAGADHVSDQFSIHYTDYYRCAPPKSYRQSLKPWNGRLVKDKWFRVMIRPFILFAYPAVLWSSLVYSLAVGWLIVLSESVSHIYRDESYHFTPLQVGLVYISPFVGGVLGTAVAGKVSDLVVRFMARKNDGVYEPEFRLLMAVPITISTVIGLMGFGWSAEERDRWIIPTVFFGVISFGCSLASTTAITFVVDSYRVYAGEALVTLNFSKNVFHGFVFSLFFPHWLESSGSKNTFLALGGIQLACMLLSIPMYVYGKRARMWTVRMNFMEKF
ncbi:MFS general substrate transporter [Cucurbitaria berberidis CBS 394.84]|uniref:MFS general substrate transporter n=1 Tax=Cucurbitaria berberidis CBS 394.84 TaxID=1168544 RepID=A0A9P4GCZ2_9PLEO|nr:MFS general substrate transporter [Cucurbitaria berberidis CBS 394.84]KAF1843224.1 MFS general substrate transporter [Cucurbitaria berberidis CBS 394.84]